MRECREPGGAAEGRDSRGASTGATEAGGKPGAAGPGSPAELRRGGAADCAGTAGSSPTED